MPFLRNARCEDKNDVPLPIVVNAYDDKLLVLRLLMLLVFNDFYSSKVKLFFWSFLTLIDLVGNNDDVDISKLSP